MVTENLPSDLPDLPNFAGFSRVSARLVPRFVSVCFGEPVPMQGLALVLAEDHALFIHLAQAKFRRCEFSRRGQRYPFDDLEIVPLYASVVEIHDADIELGIGKALGRRAFEPFQRLGVILLHPDPLIIENPEPVLRRGEFLIRGFPMELDRSGDVALDPVAGEIQDDEIELGVGVARLGQFREFA